MNGTETALLSGLPPLCGPTPRVLLLGSFPSAASLAKGRYYAFSRNHFWRLTAAAFGEAETEAYEDRIAFLFRRNIAVWDIVAECARAGSLDQAITAARPNPIAAFLAERPSIVRLALNGSKAAELFARSFGIADPIPLSPQPPFRWRNPVVGRAVDIVRLPSSSPVPSRRYRNAADKEEAWRAALAFSGNDTSLVESIIE